MTATHTPTLGARRASHSVFARILVGVDQSTLSLDACRQALRLAEPETTIEAATVSLFPPAAAAALGVPDLAERLEHDAGSALLAAGEILGPQAELRRLEGLTVDALLAEAKRIRATLLAIGAPEHARIEEMIFGGVAGELLHRARCSMLVARASRDEANFPRSIVVGLDGSEQAERAHEIAQNLATLLQSRVRTIVALGGKHLDLDEIRRRHPEAEPAAAAPVPALVESSANADLLIVGSRGLHGPRALGSVSERIAHQADCSVLVIR
jgi:nucleotide-binding universal stress UspA family protein